MSRRAEDLKSKGNACFKNNEYEKARKHYMDALKAGMEEGTVDIMHTIYGNLAHVNNKLGAYKESEKYARLAIRKKPDWFKGYYRAAVAAQSLGKLDDAIALLEKGIDNCVSNDELKTLRDSYIEKKKKPKGAAKPPPPPPPLLKADPPPAGAAAAAADPPRSATKTRAGKTSKTASKTSSESSGSGVWSSLLAAGRPADTVSEQTAAAARAGDPTALTEELCITVRRGSVALQRPGGAREAYDEYRKALQQVAKHPKELNLSGNELISLRYCFAMACHEVATLEALNSAEDELLAIIQKTKRPMPAAFYLLGLVYMRLNRFSQAASVLQLASDMLGKDARGDTHVYPGTAQTIPDTERAWRGTLRVPVQELLKQCQYPPRPDALCRLDDCQARVTVPDVQNAKRTRQETRRAIYYRDVDFVGFIQVQCLSKCQLEYHLPCWRQLKEHFGPETQRTTDKDLLNTKCLTPDCDSDICRIVTVDANGLEKHEIVSDEYRRRQQKQPQKQLSKQQKKQAAQAAAKKQQVSKSRKHRDSAPQPSEDGDTQKSPSEPPPAAAAATASATTASAAAAAPASEAAAAAAAAASSAREPAPPPAPPDLREMTVLRRGSITDDVPASKKSKKKKKGGSSTRMRGRRPAAEMFWDTADQEQSTYNGPPVIVTYNVSEDDLASRLCQLEDLRTLQFSTRSLIPDTSVQPASVPRDDQSSEEAHAILESAYQFLYDYLKEAGPTPAIDPTLLSIASELPSHCQQMIAQYGSLENFLTRLPRFYRLDELLCVEVDVAEAEALLGSAIADRVRAVDTPPPPPLWEQQQQLAELEQQAHQQHQQQQQQQQDQAEAGLSDAETAELEHQSDQDGADSESEAEMEVELEDSAPTQNGSLHTESGAADPESESATADRGHSESADPDSVEADPDPDSAEAEPVPDPSEGDADSVAEDPEDSAAEDEEEEAADSSERLVRDAGGGGARGDGAWNADPELSDDGQDSLSQSETSANDAELVAQLKQQIETLKQDKVQRDEQLAEARISQLRLERTVRQLTPRGADQQPAAAQQLTEARQQLAETRQQLAETSGRLQQAEQQRGLAARRCSEMSHQLAATQQQLAAAQQELGAAQQEVLMQQQQLAGYQQERDELGAQLAAMHEQARQYEAQLAETQQHAALMEEQAEALASQLSQTPAADPERVRQLERQLDEEEAGRRRAEAALEELRAGERRARGQYVTLLSRAGTERLDIATGRCRDAISSARRAATSSGRPDSAAPTIAVLEEALGTIDGTRAQFKETIKKACKAIASKETIDIQSLKLPEIPDIVDTAINGPGTRRAAPRTSPAASVVGSAASPRPSSRPSSVITVSSGSGSEAGRVSPAAPPPPPPPAPAPAPAPVAQASSAGSAAAPAAAPLRVPRPVTPAAAQLSAVSKQAAPTTFDALVSAIERQFGGAVPGGRDAIIRQVTSYRRRRGGALRGAGRDQIVTEVTAMLRAEAADAAPPASAWGGKANGGQPVAAAAPALTATPSREECLICRESYSRSQARKLDCGHQLHELCLRRWLQANGVMATCPICRHPFTSDTDFPSL